MNKVDNFVYDWSIFISILMIVWIESNFLARLIPKDIEYF